MRDSMTILVAHVAATLPDSITARKELLVAIATVITAHHPCFPMVRDQLDAIARIENSQKQLPLTFHDPQSVLQHDGQ